MDKDSHNYDHMHEHESKNLANMFKSLSLNFFLAIMEL